MKLICNACKLEVSKNLTELKDLNLLDENSGKDYIPQGFFIIDDGQEDIQTKGFIIINVKDLINSNYHSDGSRLNGCCGYDGLDGMNRVCLNDHEIGTENSDCWMPHYVALNPDLINFVQS
ncbi:hypothetical protein [Priestia endophytica]|uniref:hypothetical protein n=1 Tax=Priestia endophytica TaxID=135735 RepID=UPI00227F87E8|nr:hypothetical protein [Priestia endophytica]MCY8235263.1 hypothetical protein [Priestia endophytica]